MKMKDVIISVTGIQTGPEGPDSLQLVTFLEMPEVKCFIDEYSQSFIPYFEETIKDLDYAVEHSCEMMGISQDELKEFMKKNSQ